MLDETVNGPVARTFRPSASPTVRLGKEREIPIPSKLTKSLKAWKAKSAKTCVLVFPTGGCKPKLDFLDCLKAVAERAKLNSDNFWLHKFRATFATRCLWASGQASICARYSSGSVTRIWSQRCGI